MVSILPAARTALVAEVRTILAAVDADIMARVPAPECKSSGRCCKFEAYGHRLYVMTAELLHFADTIGDRKKSCVEDHTGERKGTVSLPQFFSRGAAEGCPYQVNNLCTAREARPLGCRIYFCDETAQSWQNEVYETYHAQLKALHEKYALDYEYIEWRAALRRLVDEVE